MKNILHCFLIASLIFPVNVLHAQTGMDFLGHRDAVSTSSEYVFKNFPDESLMTIKVLGGVNKPGIYHIPKGTDIFTVLSITGGVYDNAELSAVLVRKPGKKEVRTVDVRKSISDINLKPDTLDNGDTVYVNLEEKYISDNTLRTAGFISIIFGIVLSGYIIRSYVEDDNAVVP